MARTKNSKRSDGRLQSKVYLGVVDGKAKYKYVYAATQKELNAKINEVKLQLGKGGLMYQPSVTRSVSGRKGG